MSNRERKNELKLEIQNIQILDFYKGIKVGREIFKKSPNLGERKKLEFLSFEKNVK